LRFGTDVVQKRIKKGIRAVSPFITTWLMMRCMRHRNM